MRKCQASLRKSSGWHAMLDSPEPRLGLRPETVVAGVSLVGDLPTYRRGQRFSQTLFYVTVVLLITRDQHHGLGGLGLGAGLFRTAWAPHPLTIEMGIVPTGSRAGHRVYRRMASACSASGLLTAGTSSVTVVLLIVGHGLPTFLADSRRCGTSMGGGVISATVALLAAEPGCNRIAIWPVCWLGCKAQHCLPAVMVRQLHQVQAPCARPCFCSSFAWLPHLPTLGGQLGRGIASGFRP